MFRPIWPQTPEAREQARAALDTARRGEDWTRAARLDRCEAWHCAWDCGSPTRWRARCRAARPTPGRPWRARVVSPGGRASNAGGREHDAAGGRHRAAHNGPRHPPDGPARLREPRAVLAGDAPLAVLRRGGHPRDRPCRRLGALGAGAARRGRDRVAAPGQLRAVWPLHRAARPARRGAGRGDRTAELFDFLRARRASGKVVVPLSRSSRPMLSALRRRPGGAHRRPRP